MCDNALESGFRQDRQERLLREGVIEEERKLKRPLLYNELERIKRWFRIGTYH